MIEKRQFYINGSWVDPKDGRDHQVINPSTEEACATISLGGQADTDAAVAAAKAALPAWMATPVQDRIALVEKLLDLYNTRAADMAEAISMEMGAPIDMAAGQQTPAGSWHLKNFIRAAKGFEFDRPLNDRAPNDRIIYEAVGVAALITPWNWPMNQVTLKVGAAAIAGCTMVLKPSEESPLNALIFADLMDEAGFPAGVFNLVNGDGVGVGSQLSAHPDVDMVSFTGSSRAGRLISKSAADTLKRVHLELGGKGANIIFADASEGVVTRGIRKMMTNSGQSCNAPSRMLVERSIYDDAITEAIEAAENIRTGPASEQGDHIGPVVSEQQFNKIQALIKLGINEGARLIVGGLGRPEDQELGYFVRPTIFADVDNNMSIAQEEIFGPVLVAIPWEDEADMIEQANDTHYGLAAFIFCHDLSTVVRMTRALDAGWVQVNQGGGQIPGMSYGGIKQSGMGSEYSIEGALEAYTFRKRVTVAL